MNKAPILSALGLAVLVLTNTVAAAQVVRIGAEQQGGQNYQTNTVIANTLQTAGLEVSLQSFSGSGTYLTLLNAGELDIAASPSTDTYDALAGREAFAGNALDKVRILAVLQKVPYGIMVRNSDNIKSIEDLRGKRVTYGYSAKPSAQNDVRALLANGGLTIADVTPVSVPGVAQGVDALVAGRVDAAYMSLRSGKVVEADAAVGGLHFIPLSGDDTAVAAMREFAPTAGVMEVQPSQGQAGIPAAQNVLSFQYVLLGGANLSDEAAYKVVKTIYENAETISAQSRAMTGLDRSTFAQDLAGLPFHPGAMRFYDEVAAAK